MTPTGPIPAPTGTTGCSPEIRAANASEFELVSPGKQSNFILGELISGELSFIVENLPKTKPQTGCPGKWMFQQMMAHFDASVSAILGNWIGAGSDNLTTINQLTAGNAMTIEEAAKQTWTGTRAKEYGFTQVRLIGSSSGSPGQYTRVQMLFVK